MILRSTPAWLRVTRVRGPAARPRQRLMVAVLAAAAVAGGALAAAEAGPAVEAAR